MTGKDFAAKTEGWSPSEIFLSFCVGAEEVNHTPGSPSKSGTAQDASPEKGSVHLSSSNHVLSPF